MLFYLYLFLTGIFAGLLGSIIGVGGGIIVVPVLALLLKIPIHLAIGTSIISVLATSVASSARFFKKDIINIPMGLTLEIPTTLGGMAGSLSIAYLKNNVLFIIFGSFALVAGVLTFIKNKYRKDTYCPDKAGEQYNKNAGKSIFDSEYYDGALKQKIRYKIKRTHLGAALSFLAGVNSGLLGVGGGVIKVPAMNIIMNAPIKVATATSNYMIGITAVVSSIIYFCNGYINAMITIPVVAGILIGASTGSYTAIRLRSRVISVFVFIIFIIIGTMMFLRGFNILNY